MENKNLVALLTVLFVCSIIFFAVIVVNNSEKERCEFEREYPIIYIIDMEYFPGFGFDDKWCLHYSVDGVIYSAFFPSMDRLELFKVHLNQLSGNRLEGK